MKEMIAIITGDIIDSTMVPIDKRKRLISVIKEAISYVSKFSPLKYEIFRGDSFQLVIEQPEKSLLMAILLRAYLRKSTPKDCKNSWDARLAIGIGGITFQSTDIASSDGEAFQLSGRGLDNIGKKNLGIFTNWEDINEEMKISTIFADDIISNWSISQAETIIESIGENHIQKEIAAKFGKTQQAVNKILISAKDNLIKMYIKRFETIISNKIEAS